MNNIRVIILAAGKGKRMFSKFPKVLHYIAGKRIIEHILKTIVKFKINNINIVISKKYITIFKKLLNDFKIKFFFQKKPLGTGNAIQEISSSFSDQENILILCGDIPLVSNFTINKILRENTKEKIVIVTSILKNPNGYGRIIRKNGKIVKIVEEKDATIDELQIKEVYGGILFINSINLKRWIKKINNLNKQKEYYITDIIKFAIKEEYSIFSVSPNSYIEILGINNRLELSKIERIYQTLQIKKLLLKGVTILDPKRFDLRGYFKYGKDIVIDTNVIIEGKVKFGNNIRIGSGCIIKNSIIGNNCIIHPYSIIEDSQIGNYCIIGPFARIRPKNILKKNIHIGNFVEIKNSKIEKNSKIKHFGYIGDTKIGSKVNLGAGTVTCNYNGIQKNKTVIEDQVFIGANSQLIAPIFIEKGTTIAAGTTVIESIKEKDMLIYNFKRQFQKKKNKV